MSQERAFEPRVGYKMTGYSVADKQTGHQDHVGCEPNSKRSAVADGGHLGRNLHRDGMHENGAVDR